MHHKYRLKSDIFRLLRKLSWDLGWKSRWNKMNLRPRQPDFAMRDSYLDSEMRERYPGLQTMLVMFKIFLKRWSMKKCTHDNRLTQIFRYSPQSPPFSYYTFAFNVSKKIWPRQLNQYLAVCYCISKYVCLCGVLIASQCAAITSWLVADRGQPDQMVPPLCESLLSMRPLLKSRHIKG